MSDRAKLIEKVKADIEALSVEQFGRCAKLRYAQDVLAALKAAPDDKSVALIEHLHFPPAATSLHASVRCNPKTDEEKQAARLHDVLDAVDAKEINSYELQLALASRSDARLPIKLMMNSLYGKFAHGENSESAPNEDPIRYKAGESWNEWVAYFGLVKKRPPTSEEMRLHNLAGLRDSLAKRVAEREGFAEKYSPRCRGACENGERCDRLFDHQGRCESRKS